MSERKGTKALELWCKRLVKDCPEAHIENMTTSWRNGIAFCALVHYFKPNLIPLSTLNPNDIYYNNQLAFSIAERELGIPALLDPEDMVENEVPDRLSILTYLSQFYQRLGHTVTSKNVEYESKEDPVSQINTPISNVSRNFVRVDLDKCTSCGQSVYLAQRLIVSHKLYHRRCFRCYKCSIQLSPGSYSEMNDSSDICCEACKIEFNTSYDNNNDALMGMLEFSEGIKTSDNKDTTPEKEDENIKKSKTRPLSVLEKINLFEKNKTHNSIEEKLNELTLRENTTKECSTLTEDVNSKYKDSNLDLEKINLCSQIDIQNEKEPDKKITAPDENPYLVENVEVRDDLYKSNVNKFMFLQTQLSDNNLSSKENDDQASIKSNVNKFTFLQSQLSDNNLSSNENDDQASNKSDVLKFTLLQSQLSDNNLSSNDNDDQASNKSDVNQFTLLETQLNETTNNQSDNNFNSNENDNQLASNNTSIVDSLNDSKSDLTVKDTKNDLATKQKDVILIKSDIIKSEITNYSTDETNFKIIPEQLHNEQKTIPIPPRLKKTKKKEAKLLEKSKVYPDHLNPFSDDEEDEVKVARAPICISTNPFGSSDEDEEEIVPLKSTPTKRLICANPFWSDDEEPISDEESCQSSGMYSKSPMTTSTPNISTVSRRKKAKAPLPPAIAISEAVHNASCADDVASITSGSSFNSTLNSEHKTPSKLTPRSRKKKLAPTPPDSLSMYSHDANNSLDMSGTLSLNSEGGVSSRRKGPAPGLPLPARREVRARLPAHELQAQLELLDTQQLGLERQGVLIEQMIRDKCEGDEASSVPQDEVEELVIQLCELVNEKNDLFRKHTELMYIRRQQRLEQEQADIEHEIRIIQSKPIVNRTDSDKSREEQLVSRLVETVLRRDQLVQQLEDERCRERREDHAIATTIASKRAQRNSDSNTSSIKSVEEVPTPKKNKMKDKVKKQLKKAKHTLHIKKKEEKEDHKDKKNDKDHKTKWF